MTTEVYTVGVIIIICCGLFVVLFVNM